MNTPVSIQDGIIGTGFTLSLEKAKNQKKKWIKQWFSRHWICGNEKQRSLRPETCKISLTTALSI